MTVLDRRARPWICLVAAALVYAVAYLPITWAGFIWDDPDYVLNNDTLRDAHGLFRMWFEHGALPQYYPLVHTTFWVEYQLWGLEPLGYHLVNWVLHGVNALLVYRLLRALGLETIAGLAAFLFCIHPVHVESVAWITERKNVLSGLFYLAAWLTYLRFQDTESRRTWWLALLLFAGALLSKSVTASLPAAILLVAWWRDGGILKRDVLALLPFFGLGIAAGLHTAWIEAFDLGGTGRGASGAEWALSLPERLLVVGRTFWFYPMKIVWPHPLCFIYTRWVIDAADILQWLWPAATLGLLAALWALRHRIGRGPITAALFHAGTLLPALGFLNVYPFRYAFVADHFQYLASLAMIVVVAATLRRLRPRASAIPIAAVLAIPLGILTHQHARVFEGFEVLWRDTIRKNKTCWMAHNNLGTILFNRGQLEDAEQHFRRAIQLKPDHWEARLSRGLIALQRNELDAAKRWFQGVADENPDYGAAYANLGTLAAMQKRHVAAGKLWQKALELDPRYDPARQNLANMLLASRQLPAARKVIDAGVRLHPYNANFHALLAECLFWQKDAAGARVAARRALELDPTNGRARRFLETR